MIFRSKRILTPRPTAKSSVSRSDERIGRRVVALLLPRQHRRFSGHVFRAGKRKRGKSSVLPAVWLKRTLTEPVAHSGGGISRQRIALWFQSYSTTCRVAMDGGALIVPLLSGVAKRRVGWLVPSDSPVATSTPTILRAESNQEQCPLREITGVTRRNLFSACWLRRRFRF